MPLAYGFDNANGIQGYRVLALSPWIELTSQAKSARCGVTSSGLPSLAGACPEAGWGLIASQGRDIDESHAVRVRKRAGSV